MLYSKISILNLPGLASNERTDGGRSSSSLMSAAVLLGSTHGTDISREWGGYFPAPVEGFMDKSSVLLDPEVSDVLADLVDRSRELADKLSAGFKDKSMEPVDVLSRELADMFPSLAGFMDKSRGWHCMLSSRCEV